MWDLEKHCWLSSMLVVQYGDGNYRKVSAKNTQLN